MKVRTKLNETDKNRVETELTFDWSNVTEDETRELASKTLAITAQGMWRKDGKIPAGEHTMKVRDILDRERAARTPKTPQQLMAEAFSKWQAENPDGTKEQFIATLLG